MTRANLPRKPVKTASRGDAYFRKIAGAQQNEYEGAARAANTWKQYASTVKLFTKWARENRLRALPARPETVKRWVLDLARAGYANATIRAYVSGLCTWHRLHGFALDRAPMFETLKGIKRRAEPQRKVRPLLRDELGAILAMLDEENLADVRDGAMLSIGWANAMRRTELIGLDWERKGWQSGGTGTLRMNADGIFIQLLQSKASQETVVPLEIPAEHMPSAMKWLARWAFVARLQPGEPVFRGVFRDGEGGWAIGSKRLTDRAAADIVKKRVIALEVAGGASFEAAAARAEDFSGHSLRAGYCTAAAVAGVPEYQARQRSRHKSAETFAGYVRAANVSGSGLGKVGL